MFQVQSIIIVPVAIFFVGSFVQAKFTYKANFMENVEKCVDYDNKIMDATALVMASEGLGLEGNIETKDDIPEGSKIMLEIHKETDHGMEYMGAVASDLCDSLNDENAPWRTVVEAMDLSGCPVPVKVFEIERLDIDLGFAKDFLVHDYVGGYVIRIIIEDISNPPEQIVCYQVQVSIIEEEEEDE